MQSFNNKRDGTCCFQNDKAEHKIFSLCFSKFKRVLVQSVDGSCSHIASSFYDRAFGWHGELCSQTMISASVPQPMQ